MALSNVEDGLPDLGRRDLGRSERTERLAMAGELGAAGRAVSKVVVDRTPLRGVECIYGVGGEVIQGMIAGRASVAHVVTPSTSSARRRFSNPLRRWFLTVSSSAPRSRAVSEIVCPAK